MLCSLHIPDSHRSTVINLFRVPLNLLTVAVLGTVLSPHCTAPHCTDCCQVRAGWIEDRSLLFGITASLGGSSCLLAASLQRDQRGRPE